MKRIITLLLLIASFTMQGQIIGKTVEQDLDTLVFERVTKALSYVDTNVYVLKYVPPTTPNQPPVARAGADQTITLPTNRVTLNGGSSTDADGVISTYTWSKVTALVGTLSSPASSVTEYINLAAGVHTVRLTIIDNKGANHFDDVVITVLPATGGTTVNFAFTQIPITDPDLICSDRGAQQWHNGSQGIPYPTVTQTGKEMGVYFRGQWSQFEGATAGSYNWTWFDAVIKSAITKGQRLAFGVMTVTPGSEQGHAFYDGAKSSYPEYLHKLMQAEANKDFINGDLWIPNYNSTHYITALRNLHTAIKGRLLNEIYTPTSGPNANKPVRYADAISQIDIRGYGSWGEWHTCSDVGNWSNYPAGRAPTAATFKAIIDAHTQIFDRWPMVVMIAAFSGRPDWIQCFQPYPEVAHYAATTSNAWGRIGWRKDQYGATDSYLADLLENNNVTWAGSPPLKDILMNTWKTSPITGEPPSWTVDGPDLMRQVTTYHTASFGNGNWGGTPSASLQVQIRDAFKKCGYRLIIKDGKAVTNTGIVTITLNWQNIGIAPMYEVYDVVYEAVSSTGVVTVLGKSAFKPKLFLPITTTTAATDTFNETLTGQYTLRVRLKDPSNYMPNGTIAINGRNADGSYTIGIVNL